jgi:hypothetical protein
VGIIALWRRLLALVGMLVASWGQQQPVAQARRT